MRAYAIREGKQQRTEFALFVIQSHSHTHRYRIEVHSIVVSSACLMRTVSVCLDTLLTEQTQTKK